MDLDERALKSINCYTKQGDIIIISVILMRTEGQCENHDVGNIIARWEKHACMFLYWKKIGETTDRAQSTCKIIR